jgi:hypothetical protein
LVAGVSGRAVGLRQAALFTLFQPSRSRYW